MSVTSTYYVWGARIKLPYTGLSQDTDIGLYVTGGVAQIRLIQNSVSTTDTWKAGIITEGGIGEIGESADFAIGGNVAKVEGFDLELTNIIGTTPFWKKLVDAGISLAGCVCEIVEFDTSTDPATETILRRGVIESAPSWSIDSYKLKVSEPYYKRDTLIGALVDDGDVDSNGKLKPITFGEFVPEYNVDGTYKIKSFVKAIRISQEEINLVNTDIDGIMLVSSASINAYKVNSSDSINVQIFIDQEAYILNDLDDLKASLINKHVKFINGDNGGVYRKILDVSALLPSAGIINLVLDYYLENAPTSSDWLHIVTVSSQLFIDTWPCKNFYDAEGNILTSEIALYSVDSNQYLRLPGDSFSIDDVTKNNSLTFITSKASDDINTIESFVIVPCDANSFHLISSDDSPSSWGFSGWYYLRAGLWVYIPAGTDTLAFEEEALQSFPSSLLVDKLKATYIQNFIKVNTAGYNYDLFMGIVGKMPAIPKDFDYDFAYIGIKADLSINDPAGGSGGYTLTSIARLKAFRGTAIASPLERAVAIASVADASIALDNLPDSYYDDDPAPNTKDVNFYKPTLSDTLIAGYENGEITSIVKELKPMYDNILVGLKIGFATGPGATTRRNLTNKIYEVALILKKSAPLGDALYISFAGRIYYSTWGSRKTSANLIESPIDILEHINRLQDWTEAGSTALPGNAYASEALINTASTEGGFDYVGLDDIRTFKAARQILDEAEARSGRIKESLCKQYFLCSYTNVSGQECVNTIHHRNEAATVNITLAHILPDSLSSFDEISVEDIYCNPFVRYAKNAATDKFDGIIRVTNSQAATFNDSYVSGWSGGDAETIWNLCHALYSHYKISTEPPTEMTDCQWIRNEEDAKQYLLMWLEWQGAYLTTGNVATIARKRRFSFDVAYSTAMTIGVTHTPWFVSMRFNITLPHQTNNSTLQCIIEGVKFDVNANRATVSAICYDITEEMEYYVKDTYTSYASIGWDDWKDTVLTKAENGANENDVKDSA